LRIRTLRTVNEAGETIGTTCGPGEPDCSDRRETTLAFARFLLGRGARAGDERAWWTLAGRGPALAMARDHKPHAITLDIYLPDIEGWRVLDRLKNDLLTRDIPVCMISD